MSATGGPFIEYVLEQSETPLDFLLLPFVLILFFESHICVSNQTCIAISLCDGYIIFIVIYRKWRRVRVLLVSLVLIMFIWYCYICRDLQVSVRKEKRKIATKVSLARKKMRCNVELLRKEQENSHSILDSPSVCVVNNESVNNSSISYYSSDNQPTHQSINQPDGNECCSDIDSNILSNESELSSDLIMTRDDQEPITESERLLLLLLFQARHLCENIEIEDFALLFNNMAYRRGDDPLDSRWFIHTQTYNTIVNNCEPVLFKPTIFKYIYSSCQCKTFLPINSNYEMLKNGSFVKTTRLECRQRCQHEGSLDPKVLLRRKDSSFVSILLKDWLEFYIPKFYSMLRFPARNGTSRHKLHDVTDTDYYKQIAFFDVNHPQQAVIRTITLTLAFDGVNYVSDGSKQLYPLIAFINELAFNQRVQNPFLLALHEGEGGPSSDCIIRPLIEELLHYHTTPLEIKISESLTEKYVKRLYFLTLILFLDFLLDSI